MLVNLQILDNETKEQVRHVLTNLDDSWPVPTKIKALEMSLKYLLNNPPVAKDSAA